MKRYVYEKEKLEEVVKKCLSIAQVCRELGIRPVGGNYKTLKSKFKKWDIDTSHFTGQAWNQGEKFTEFGRKTPINEILVKDSTYTNNYTLKKRLYAEGLKENKCEECGVDEWQGKEITCELEHINGDNLDHRLENLRILCPNCHSQTKTFRGRKKKGTSSLRTLQQNRYENPKFVEKPKKEKKPRVVKPKPKCLNCGNDCRDHQSKYCSRDCYQIHNEASLPDVFELIDNFKELKSYLAVGRHYGVSDNAVRKWVKKYKIENYI
jgi:hypothetical protein